MATILQVMVNLLHIIFLGNINTVKEFIQH